MYVNKQDILFIFETWNINDTYQSQAFSNVDFKFFISPAKKTPVKGRDNGGIMCGINSVIYKPNNICIRNNFICMSKYL